MEERTPRGPAWGLLYVVAAGMLGVLGIVEAYVPAGPLLRALELIVAIATFAAMALWVHVNRRALDLAGERDGNVRRVDALSIRVVDRAAGTGPARMDEPRRQAPARRAAVVALGHRRR